MKIKCEHCGKNINIDESHVVVQTTKTDPSYYHTTCMEDLRRVQRVLRRQQGSKDGKR